MTKLSIKVRDDHRPHALTVIAEFESWGDREPGRRGLGVVTMKDGTAFAVWKTKSGTIVVREVTA